MAKAMLLVAATMVLAANLIGVVDAVNTLEKARGILKSYKELVVNGRKEGGDCKTDDPKDRDKAYEYIGQVAGKCAEDLVADTKLDNTKIFTLLGEHEARIDICAVSQDLYCNTNLPDGTATCTKCGGTCYEVAPYVKAVMEATDWKDLVDIQAGGSGNKGVCGGGSTGGSGGGSTGGSGGNSTGGSSGGGGAGKGKESTNTTKDANDKSSGLMSFSCGHSLDILVAATTIISTLLKFY